MFFIKCMNEIASGGEVCLLFNVGGARQDPIRTRARAGHQNVTIAPP